MQRFCAWAWRYLVMLGICVELDRLMDLQTLQLPVAMLMALCVIGLMIPNRTRSASWQR